MNVEKNSDHNTAAKAIASTFGVLSGIGGIIHGIGEILQGNVTPESIVVMSWSEGPLATYLGGDPAMTVVPNFLITGILTLTISLAAIVWSVAFVQKKHGGLILLLISLLMLLTGGGFGPPILGMLASLGGMGIHARYQWWRAHLPVAIQTLFAKLWPWVFGICTINGIFLVFGHVAAVYLVGPANPELFVFSFFFAILLLLLSIMTGIGYDIQKSEKHLY